MRLLLAISCLGLICAAPALAQTTTPAPGACTSDEISNPTFPADGPDPSLPASSKASYATHYAQRAIDYMKCGDKVSAGRNFDLAVSLDPDNIKIVARRADLFFDTGDFADAATDLTKVIDHRAQIGQGMNIRFIYGNRAQAYRRLNRNREALDDLTAVLEGADGAPLELNVRIEYRRRRGEVQFELGQWESAASDFRWLDVNKDAVCDDYRRWGLAELSLQQVEMANMLFKHGQDHRSDPAKADASCQRASLELARAQGLVARNGKGDAVAARLDYQAVLAAEPDNALAAAGLHNITAPPPPPTFGDPAQEAVPLPIPDLQNGSPPRFCSQEAMNTYLGGVSSDVEAANRNVAAIHVYMDALTERRKQYVGNELMSYQEQQDDVGLFDKEFERMNTRGRQAADVSTQLQAYWRRVVNDKTLIVRCSKDGTPIAP